MLWEVGDAQEHILNEFCGPVFGPILLTLCLCQDAPQWALLPGSKQSGPLQNPLLVAKPEFLHMTPKVHSHSLSVFLTRQITCTWAVVPVDQAELVF